MSMEGIHEKVPVGGGGQATYTHMLWWPPNMAVIQSLKGERVLPKQKREISMFDLHL